MKLYHCSNEKLSTLLPQLGERRHGGESHATVGQKVVWLSNCATSVMRDEEGRAAIYQYEVEVDEHDPDLYLDEEFARFIAQSDDVLGEPLSLRWYYLTRAIGIQTARTWDEKEEAYM